MVDKVYQHKRKFLQPVWALKDNVDFLSLLPCITAVPGIMPGNIPNITGSSSTFGQPGRCSPDEILHEKQIRSYEFAYAGTGVKSE